MIKKINVAEIGEVIISRRKGTKHIRISLPKNGEVKLSVPYGVSEHQAISFLNSKLDWIQKNKAPKSHINSGQRIGKSHYLNIIQSDGTNPRTSVVDNELRLFLPQGALKDSERIQTLVKSAVNRVLQKQADNLLPSRTTMYAKKFGFQVKSVKCKSLKTRWGSCSNINEIILNIHLMQLDWKLIDYVIIHELCHTVQHNHSQRFWLKVEECLPNYRELRKSLKEHHSSLIS